MSFFFGKAHDYNDFVKQVRGFVQGHPRVLKTDETDPQDGITITGSGAGELYVSTESFTPAGVSPGTTYRLTCTVAGSAVTSPAAQFTVEQVGTSPAVLGTLTAGERWVPDQDHARFSISPSGSPGLINSPEISHGLELYLTTSTAWSVSDTIEFALVDHNIGRDANDNFVEEEFSRTGEDANGDFETRWHARIPSIAQAGASPELQCFVHMQTNSDNVDQVYTAGIAAGNSYLASNSAFAQAGSSGARYMPLSNIPFAFWLTCDADGFYAVARVGAVYEHITCQLLEVFATGNQHPLPLFVGAMSEASTTLASETDSSAHSPFWNAGSEASAQFRWVDGTWYNVENKSTGYFNGTVTRFIAPWRSRQSNNAPLASFDDDLDWSNMSTQILPRYDGSYELIPATLILTDPQDAVVGDLKFIKYVTGNGLNAEDTTSDVSVSPARDYIAFQSAQLSGNDNFCAMELVP